MLGGSYIIRIIVLWGLYYVGVPPRAELRAVRVKAWDLGWRAWGLGLGCRA